MIGDRTLAAKLSRKKTLENFTPDEVWRRTRRLTRARSMDRVDKAIWSLKSLIEATDRPQLPDQIEGLVYLGLRTTCRGGGMADAADLKSSIGVLT